MVNYWNLGGAKEGRFALLDFYNNLWEYRIVPEPSGLVAVITGFVAVAGLRRRRQ